LCERRVISTLACALVYAFMAPGKPIDVADFGVMAIA
jgi:hypothetical protein